MFPAYRRLAGFQDACIKAGVPHKVIIRDFGLSPIRKPQHRCRKSLTTSNKNMPVRKRASSSPTMIMPIFFLNLLIRKYHTLPNDYELIGFDGAPISEQAIYPISTVGQQIDQIADEAVSLLVSQMQERKNATRCRLPSRFTRPFRRF